MSKKIATTLTWHIQDPFASDYTAFREDIPKMVRELRALKAVARAAERVQPAVVGMLAAVNALRDGPPMSPPPQVGDLTRALSRLRRLSSPTPRRGTKR